MITFNIKSIITRRLPVLTWSQTYNSNKLIFDIIAGITVGLVVMPQALANAAIAGLDPQYGLYAAFVGGFIYFFLGTSENITVGPEAVICLMTYQQVANRSSDYAILLCLLTGVVQFVMVIFRLDSLMDFFSIPVTAGYISASSLIIGSSQLKNLFGLDVSSSGFVEDVMGVVENVTDIKYSDLILGVACIVALLCLRELQNFKFKNDENKPVGTQNPWNHVFKMVANSRNIIVILICSIAAYLFEAMGNGSPFTLTGTIKQGLPSFQFPPFKTVIDGNRNVAFTGMISDLGSSIILVPVVSALTNIAILKGLAENGRVDASQELLCLSMINIVGSFFSSMPVTASFSRSAVNKSSGVQTPAGGIITSMLVLIALEFLTPYLYYVPKTSLAALIISAIIFMIEYEVVKPLWRSNKKDLVILIVTFFGCLFFEIEYGILMGVVLNIMFLLYPSARPIVTIETKKNEFDSEYLMITPKSSLYFPATDYVNSTVEMAVTTSGNLPVVINCQYIIHTDFTAAKGISNLVDEFQAKRITLHFVNTGEHVMSVFQNVLSENFIYFNSIEDFEATLSGKRSGKEKYIDNKKATIWRKYSVPLTSIICTIGEPDLKRRHSTIQR